MIGRLVLLWSLFLVGTVPQGMMRVAGPDGVQLVICTGNGPLQVLMPSDGSDPFPTTPDQPDQKTANACLNVLISAIAVQSLDDINWASTLPVTLSSGVDQGRVATAKIYTPHQPRAPPRLS